MALQDSEFIKLFFGLLRSGLYGTPLPEEELPGSIDWEGVTALADKHGVFGTIIESVQMLPDHLRPTGQVKAMMTKFALGLIQANLILDKTVAQLVGFLSEHDIKGVLLKGQGVARYYRKPQMRQSGDIDFYVGRKAYRRAMKLCREQLNEDPVLTHQSMLHYVFYMNGVEIELHRIAAEHYSRRRNSEFQAWIADELEHSAHRRTLTLNDTEVSVPSYDFDALYIFYHAWNHLITGGIGLRQLSDWAMIFHNHSGDIDTARLTENIGRFGLTKGWKLMACIAVNHLGVAADKMPLYDPTYTKKSEKILEEIITSGNFGYHSEAGIRMMNFGHSLSDQIGKLRSITEYFVTMFPIMPGLATSIYFHRIYTGIKTSIKRRLGQIKSINRKS